MGYDESYALVKAAKGTYEGVIETPATLLGTPVADVRDLRDRCEMALVREYDDWYTGTPEVNISKSIHAHCTKMARDKGRPLAEIRRIASLLAFVYAALDHDADDAWLLLEHVLMDLHVEDGDRLLPVHCLQPMEKRVGQWRRDRHLPPDLSCLDRERQRLWHDIQRWEVDPKSRLDDIKAKVGGAVDAIGDKVPERVVKLVQDALEGGMRMAFDAARYTAGFGSVQKALRERGHAAESLSDLRRIPLEEMRDEAVSTMRWACAQSSLLGAATGAVGLPGIVADLPALMTLNMRLISRMALLYGFDVAEPSERHFALNLLGASSADGAAKTAFLLNLNQIALDVATRKTWEELSQHVLVALLRQLAQVIGFRLTKSGLAKSIPLVGGVVGAGVNYAFTAQTAEAAFMMYRKRWLTEHCLAR